MNPLPQNPVAASGSFAAMKSVPYRLQFIAYVLAMMADNIEHVISYWVVFQKFHSPTLGGFAVLSHWLPFLLFSVAVGGLADRFDPRRIIQCGMLLFIVASAGWGFFFITDTIQMWHAMLLLVIHGCAGVLWQTPNQLLLYDLVGPADLPSAVRLNAMARYLGILVGPAVGGVIMLTLGTSHGIIFNTLFYLPMLLWLFWAPVRDKSVAVRRFAMRGFADIIETMRAIGTQPVLTAMTWLAGLTSFMIGNAYHAQMPGFAGDLGHGDPGVSYSVLLAADAGGALLAGIALESWGRLKGTPRTAITLAMLWSVALFGFAAVKIYPVAIVLLFFAGFFELSFNTMAQALVQLNAPHDIRGRVVGLYNMAGLGMRAFSGITVGVFGAAIGIHWSLGLSAAVLLALLCLLYPRATKKA
ncbi:MFS transporter [Bradyrhizobium sp. OK095]|uniref:MFS transporter n=1 Tax=Bradyrhizobium sp. OK095 TaxID=1882760 RepID=UPI0008B8C50A|nr:MFS transporter [Bradyrhizobium sp. OK095]SEN17599.1 Transmembrane secretion effector [Bradyrhizobium sp. OK095]